LDATKMLQVLAEAELACLPCQLPDNTVPHAFLHRDYMCKQRW
jgi:hypothetical protein